MCIYRVQLGCINVQFFFVFYLLVEKILLLHSITVLFDQFSITVYKLFIISTVENFQKKTSVIV